MTAWEGNPNVQEAGQLRPAYRAYLERFEPHVRDVEQALALLRLPSDSPDKVAVIIDDRGGDPWIPRVIANFQQFLPEWPVFWLSLKGTGDPVQRLNKLLLDPAFWQGFDEEHILLFQRDTVCFQQLDSAFLAYDFIGAPCGSVHPRWDGEVTFDMNGGLSLRKRSAMLAALAHWDPDGGMPEDVFFTRALRDMGAKLPTFDVACSFSLENEGFYNGLPFGVHGTDKLYHSDKLAAKMVAAAEAKGHMRTQDPTARVLR